MYGLAYQFMLAPLMAITWPTSGILLATLREEDPHGPRAQAMVEAVLSATALIVVPAMLYLTFALAFPVHALLSPRWAAVPGIVAWLAPAGALQAISSYNGALLMVAGRARAQFALTVLNAAVLVTTFVLSLPYGLPVLVKAYTIVVTLLSLAFLTLIAALTGLGLRRLVRSIAPAALASGLAVLAVAATTGTDPERWTTWVEVTAIYGGVVMASLALFHVHVRRTFKVFTLRTPHQAAATGR